MSPAGHKSVQWLCKDLNGELENQSFLTQELKNNKPTGRKYIHGTKFDMSGEVGIGYTNKGNAFYFDKEDYDKIKNYTWSEANEHIVSGCNGDFGKRTVFLSTLITNFKWDYIDHIDRNPYNNQKSNLRKSTHAQNMKNKRLNKNNASGIIGVRKSGKKWQADIGIKGRLIYLGSYENILDAIMIRLYAEMYFYKEFAPQIKYIKKYGFSLENMPDDIREKIKKNRR